MDLPNLLDRFKSEDKPLVHRFVAIHIAPQSTQAAIWEVVNQSTNIVEIGPVETWTPNDDQSLVKAIDASLSPAISQIDEDPDQVVFGLPETWISEDSIAPARRQTLKFICDKLSFEPVGFVVNTEAMAHYLKDQDGSPPSAILIQVMPKEVAVTLVNVGEIEGTQVVGRSPDICSDVEEGLARFPDADALPARMLLFDGDLNLEELQQQLIDYDWQSHLPFLHIPNIQALENDSLIKSIAITGGSEVAKSLGLLATNAQNREPEPNQKASKETAQPDPTSAQESEDPDAKETPESNELSEDQSELPDKQADFGFSPVEANAETEPQANVSPEKTDPKTEEKTAEAPESEITSGASDNSQPIINHPTKPSGDTPEKAIPEDSGDSDKDEPEFEVNDNRPNQSSKSFSLPFSFPKLSLPSMNAPPILFIGIGVLILAAIGLTIAYWQLPSATVNVYVELRNLEQQLEFQLDPNLAQVDLEARTVPAERRTVTVTGSESKSTTGTNTIGDRATGTVEIFNRTSSEKSFEAGTEITSLDQELIFTLNDAVQLASASTSEGDDFTLITEPSRATVGVTAADIGAEYNVSADTKFRVANFSQDNYVANATEAFAGGSSREVSAVSQEDQQALRQTLIESLNQQVTQKVNESTQNAAGVFTSEEPEVIEESYDNDVGEEAESLTLSMEMNQNVYLYDLGHITMLAQNVLSDQIPQGYSLQPDKTEVELLQTQINEDGTASASARIALKLMPQLDTNQIASEIRGKYPPVTESYFKSLTGFKRVETQFNPPLPGRLNTFPRKIENITILIHPTN